MRKSHFRSQAHEESEPGPAYYMVTGVLGALVVWAALVVFLSYA
jgi:hypothetical protein